MVITPTQRARKDENQCRSKLDNWGGGGAYSYIRVHRP